MQLLEFMNLGGAELFLLMVFLMPFILTVYCLIDIIRSNFKDTNSKLLFIIVVLLAPLIGSIIYLALKKGYIKPSEPFNPYS